MLVEFSVSNFLSFRDEQRFSLVAAEDRENFDNTIATPALPKERLLRSAVIYGPNAAGKSNLFQALAFVRNLVVNSLNRNPEQGTGVRPFRLSKAAYQQPTTFELIFVHSDVRYTFRIVLDAARIREESLYAHPNMRAQLWYRREANDAGDVPDVTFGRNLRGRLEILQGFIRPNLPVLALATLSNQVQLIDVYRWFDEQLVLWFHEPGSSFTPVQARQIMSMYVANSPQLHQPLSALLRLADVGIQDIAVREDVTVSLPLDGQQLSLFPELQEASQRRQRYTQLRHSGDANVGEDVFFSLEDESRGTQQLFILGSVLLTGLQKGQILVVDELDTSLHPQLVRALVALFHNNNPLGAQLIFNTHDASLLRDSTFSRDQVWFVEKDGQGGSHIYPLLDFEPANNDEALEEGYLRGRYGAVPLIDLLTWKELQPDAAAS